ncbi:corrinoid protein [Eubacterium limosum]|uniref:corrinoid protein n=1 Tax=Eubacterium limosum TaxID=1736 RepID=UPI001062CF00|nr:corrinoid protein [Eubacterium limosum]
MTREEVMAKLKESVVEMDADLAEEAAKAALEAGVEPLEAISEGLSAGMQVMSDMFDEGEAFVPQLLVAAEAFETAVNILTGDLSDEEKAASKSGKVLIHTVQGDVHDIGKNIVKTMFEANNFQVYDLGRDVAVEEVVEKAKEYAVDIIAGSALMTTTMPAQKDILRLLEEEGIRDEYIVMYGGAPVFPEWCTDIGADGYADTAAGAVEVAKDLIAKKAS